MPERAGSVAAEESGGGMMEVKPGGGRERPVD